MYPFIPATEDHTLSRKTELSTANNTKECCTCDEKLTTVSSMSTQRETATIISETTTTMSEEELVQRLETIRKELTLDKTILSSTRRKRESANDDRMSAKGIGIVGACILCTVVLLIVLMDAPTIVSNIVLIWRNIFRKP